MANAAEKKAQNMAALKAQRMARFECQGATVYHQNDDLGVLVLVRCTTSQNSVTMVAFSGRKEKPEIYAKFGGMTYAERYLQQWLTRLQEVADRKASYKAEQAAKVAAGHGLKVGDILSSTWGWEQTNWEYFQVTKLVGKRSVEVREVAQTCEETGQMQGLCSPLKNAFRGEAKTYRVSPDGSIKTRSFGAYASKKEPLIVAGMEIYTPDRFTSYA